jgi:hypothetical protein
MVLSYSDGRTFAQGACHCTIDPWSGPGLNRIILDVLVEGILGKAVVDTGGAFLVLSQPIADFLRPRLVDALGPGKIGVRGQTIEGTLYRLRLGLLAAQGQGENLDIEVTALLPEPQNAYDLPTILGLAGCLERLRFAVDPGDDTFHFGAI